MIEEKAFQTDNLNSPDHAPTALTSPSIAGMLTPTLSAMVGNTVLLNVRLYTKGSTVDFQVLKHQQNLPF